MAVTQQNSVIKINYAGSGNHSQFVYDGFSRRTAVSEYSGGIASGSKLFIWGVGELLEVRNASSVLVSQYFRLGQTISGINYFYAEDHLTSVREMTDNSQNIQAEYSYNGFGQPIRIAGGLAADSQYAHYYIHSRSALNLTYYRAYSADLSRWLSRDPAGELGGINLYAYANNDPVDNIDPSGLECKLWGTDPEYFWGKRPPGPPDIGIGGGAQPPIQFPPVKKKKPAEPTSGFTDCGPGDEACCVSNYVRCRLLNTNPIDRCCGVKNINCQMQVRAGNTYEKENWYPCIGKKRGSPALPPPDIGG